MGRLRISVSVNLLDLVNLSVDNGLTLKGAWEKLERLKASLARGKRLMVALSGGVDSAFLLKVASQVLGSGVVAVTAVSPLRHRREVEEAEELAKEMGARLLKLQTDELSDPAFRDNPPERCYLCKKALFLRVLRVASEEGIREVADGSNLDDLQGDRPGMQALRELGIRSPLLEVGLKKAEIRALAKELGLRIWNKPPESCLATRVPFGIPLDEDLLRRIGGAEEDLRASGLNLVRVRYRPEGAVVEVGRSERDLAEGRRGIIGGALERWGLGPLLRIEVYKGVE